MGRKGVRRPVFTPVNGYGIVIFYKVDQQRFFVSADNQEDGSYAYFEFFRKENSIIDGQSPNGVTVEKYFKTVYNDPDIGDVYLYSVQLMEQYIYDTFGMTIDELYALPVGEQNYRDRYCSFKGDTYETSIVFWYRYRAAADCMRHACINGYDANCGIN